MCLGRGRGRGLLATSFSVSRALRSLTGRRTALIGSALPLPPRSAPRPEPLAPTPAVNGKTRRAGRIEKHYLAAAPHSTPPAAIFPYAPSFSDSLWALRSRYGPATGSDPLSFSLRPSRPVRLSLVLPVPLSIRSAVRRSRSRFLRLRLLRREFPDPFRSACSRRRRSVYPRCYRIRIAVGEKYGERASRARTV